MLGTLNMCTERKLMTKRKQLQHLADADISRVIEMAWEDRTPFEAIFGAYGLSEGDVIKVMRAQLKRKSFELWRERVSGRNTKHAQHTVPGALRHKADNRRRRDL
jgi:uncharacterized protein (TIGR03643 family)